jgi:hypothetical protein
MDSERISTNGHAIEQDVKVAVPTLDDAISHGWWRLITPENYEVLRCLPHDDVLLIIAIAQTHALSRYQFVLKSVTEDGPFTGPQKEERGEDQQILNSYIEVTTNQRHKILIDLKKKFPYNKYKSA